jgi:squalene synthase HpnC
MLSMMLRMSAVNTVQHYENFPVASLLLPKHAVPAVQALYRFARTADDIADDCARDAGERLAQLDELSTQLASPQTASLSVISDLELFIAQGKLPVSYLHQLLSAFKQDVTQDADHDAIRHATMESLLDYCSRSANPVGRLMLHSVGAPCTAASFTACDQICTSLQLINFWQDLAKDDLDGRIYIPNDWFIKYGSPISPNDVAYGHMMKALCQDARERMWAGAPLLRQLKGRFKAEIALTMAGGLRILEKLDSINYAVNDARPKLTWRDVPACLRIAWRLYLFK